MKHLLIAVLAAAIVAGCGAPTQAEKKIHDEQRDVPRLAPPEPKVCSDYANGQEILADELHGKLSRADKKSLDKDGDGRYCEEPGTKWKDTLTHAQGLPPFEVAFVADGDVPGLKAGEITIDISGVNEPNQWLLEAISWKAIREVGPSSETRYRSAIFTYRDAETFKEMDAFGIYVADQEAVEIINDFVREERGWKIDLFPGKVPEGGYVGVITYYGPGGPDSKEQ